MNTATCFPPRAYLHISNMGRFGRVIRELEVSEAGDIGKAAESIDDDTVSFTLIEEGQTTDASEDVAAKWFELYRDEIELDPETGEALVPRFVRNHSGDLIANLEGEIAVERLNSRRRNEHQFARAS